MDPHGQVLFGVTYDAYRLVDGIAWPMRMVFQSKQGRIELEMDSIQLNQPPLPAAFVPPRRAEKLP